jgi:hypothetical protein
MGWVEALGLHLDQVLDRIISLKEKEDVKNQNAHTGKV